MTAKILADPTSTFLLGLGVGLWVAVNIWFVRYAWGYKAGVKFCLEAIKPLELELNKLVGELPSARVTEAMRRKLADFVAEERETRH